MVHLKVKEKEARLQIAQKIRKALESQRHDWIDQLESLTRESQSLEEQAGFLFAHRGKNIF